MISNSAYLNKDLFEEDVELVPVRNGYGKGVVVAGEENENVVVLCADLTESTRSHWFKEKFPERFFELGVAEQNLATVASGLSISGKIPFISSYAAFSPGRNWEQLRTAAYNASNIKIAGHHAGISVGPDGATHQAIEDIATMRVVAGTRVFVPCDVHEAQKATEAAAKVWGPVYIRLAREKTPVITTKLTPFKPGKVQVFWESKKPDVVIIAAGPLIYNALLAAEALEKKKIGSVVLNNHTVSPIDAEGIVKYAKKYGAVVTVEEHQINGGMGSAVAEVLAKKNPVPQEFVGMDGVFGESGKPSELLERYGMGVKDIEAAARKVIRRK